MKNTPQEFLCKKCLKKMAEYDANRKRVWRLKIKEVKSKAEVIKIKKNL